VRINTAELIRTINNFSTANTPLIIIYNPKVGEFAKNHIVVSDDVFDSFPENNSNSIIGFIIDNQSTLADIQRFTSNYPNYPHALIHDSAFSNPDLLVRLPDFQYHVFNNRTTSTDYQNLFSLSNRILIRDGFNQMRNADYPEEEFFLDLHKHYQTLGFQGFGDYSIVGSPYAEKGGAAYTVAIHVTYVNANNDLLIRHFLSDRTQSAVDPGGKFLEALNKLVAFNASNPGLIFNSSAINEYINLYHQQHFPGLGFVKKLSMRHHVELMSSIV
jgi:hypothetical protein